MGEMENSSDSDELKSATLDQLYKEQVKEIRNLLLKTPDAPDLEKCRRWMSVFNNITKSEKVARNCLCMLMHQQIANYGCLRYPFSNLENCRKNLECVLNELDEQSPAISRRLDLNLTPNEPFSDKLGYPNAFNAESIQLKLELDALRLQLTGQQIENAKLKEIAERFRVDTESNERFIDDVKTKILSRMRDKLLEISDHYEGPFTKLKLFESVFQVYSEDLEFMDIIKKFDMDFENILNRHMELEISKHKVSTSHEIVRKFLRKNAEVREKYERRLTIQSMAQRLQLKLAKLKCFSVLRQIFIRSHNKFGNVDLWNILQILEEKYQAVVKGI